MKLAGYRVRPTLPEDEHAALGLFESDPGYFELIQGAPPEAGEFQSLVTELPPGKSYDDKFVYGVFTLDGGLAAIVDLIRDYPSEGVWFIGLLFVANDLRHRGLGTSIASAIREHVARENGDSLRIAVAEENAAAMRFWTKAGFKTIYTAERERPMLQPLQLQIMQRTV